MEKQPKIVETVPDIVENPDGTYHSVPNAEDLNTKDFEQEQSSEKQEDKLYEQHLTDVENLSSKRAALKQELQDLITSAQNNGEDITELQAKLSLHEQVDSLIADAFKDQIPGSAPDDLLAKKADELTDKLQDLDPTSDEYAETMEQVTALREAADSIRNQHAENNANQPVEEEPEEPEPAGPGTLSAGGPAAVAAGVGLGVGLGAGLAAAAEGTSTKADDGNESDTKKNVEAGNNITQSVESEDAATSAEVLGNGVREEIGENVMDAHKSAIALEHTVRGSGTMTRLTSGLFDSIGMIRNADPSSPDFSKTIKQYAGNGYKLIQALRGEAMRIGHPGIIQAVNGALANIERALHNIEHVADLHAANNNEKIEDAAPAAPSAEAPSIAEADTDK